MARYIDADLLIKNIAKIEDLRTLSTKTIGEAISKTPTADVVEVVRCGKCKHGEVSIISRTKDGEETIACYCNAKNTVSDLEYYCACGKRRDTE